MKASFKKMAGRFGIAAFLFFFIKGLIWLAVFFGLAQLIWPKNEVEAYQVWEAHVQDTARQTLRFHIMAPEENADSATVHQFGRRYLENKDHPYHELTVRPCPDCPIDREASEVRQVLKEQGYAIYEAPAQ